MPVLKSFGQSQDSGNAGVGFGSAGTAVNLLTNVAAATAPGKVESGKLVYTGPNEVRITNPDGSVDVQKMGEISAPVLDALMKYDSTNPPALYKNEDGTFTNTMPESLIKVGLISDKNSPDYGAVKITAPKEFTSSLFYKDSGIKETLEGLSQAYRLNENATFTDPQDDKKTISVQEYIERINETLKDNVKSWQDAQSMKSYMRSITGSNYDFTDEDVVRAVATGLQRDGSWASGSTLISISPRIKNYFQNIESYTENNGRPVITVEDFQKWYNADDRAGEIQELYDVLLHDIEALSKRGKQGNEYDAENASQLADDYAMLTLLNRKDPEMFWLHAFFHNVGIMARSFALGTSEGLWNMGKALTYFNVGTIGGQSAEDIDRVFSDEDNIFGSMEKAFDDVHRYDALISDSAAAGAQLTRFAGLLTYDVIIGNAIGKAVTTPLKGLAGVIGNGLLKAAGSTAEIAYGAKGATVAIKAAATAGATASQTVMSTPALVKLMNTIGGALVKTSVGAKGVGAAALTILDQIVIDANIDAMVFNPDNAARFFAGSQDEDAKMAVANEMMQNILWAGGLRATGLAATAFKKTKPGKIADAKVASWMAKAQVTAANIRDKIPFIDQMDDVMKRIEDLRKELEILDSGSKDWVKINNKLASQEQKLSYMRKIQSGEGGIRDLKKKLADLDIENFENADEYLKASDLIRKNIRRVELSIDMDANKVLAIMSDMRTNPGLAAPYRKLFSDAENISKLERKLISSGGDAAKEFADSGARVIAQKNMVGNVSEIRTMSQATANYISAVGDLQYSERMLNVLRRNRKVLGEAISDDALQKQIEADKIFIEKFKTYASPELIEAADGMIADLKEFYAKFNDYASRSAGVLNRNELLEKRGSGIWGDNGVDYYRVMRQQGWENYIKNNKIRAIMLRGDEEGFLRRMAGATDNFVDPVQVAVGTMTRGARDIATDFYSSTLRDIGGVFTNANKVVGAEETELQRVLGGLKKDIKNSFDSMARATAEGEILSLDEVSDVVARFNSDLFEIPGIQRATKQLKSNAKEIASWSPQEVGKKMRMADRGGLFAYALEAPGHEDDIAMFVRSGLGYDAQDIVDGITTPKQIRSLTKKMFPELSAQDGYDRLQAMLSGNQRMGNIVDVDMDMPVLGSYRTYGKGSGRGGRSNLIMTSGELDFGGAENPIIANRMSANTYGMLSSLGSDIQDGGLTVNELNRMLMRDNSKKIMSSDAFREYSGLVRKNTALRDVSIAIDDLGNKLGMRDSRLLAGMGSDDLGLAVDTAIDDIIEIGEYGGSLERTLEKMYPDAPDEVIGAATEYFELSYIFGDKKALKDMHDALRGQFRKAYISAYEDADAFKGLTESQAKSIRRQADIFAKTTTSNVMGRMQERMGDAFDLCKTAGIVEIGDADAYFDLVDDAVNRIEEIENQAIEIAEIEGDPFAADPFSENVPSREIKTGYRGPTTIFDIEEDISKRVKEAADDANTVRVLDQNGVPSYFKVDPMLADIINVAPHVRVDTNFDRFQQSISSVFHIGTTGFGFRTWGNQFFKDFQNSFIGAPGSMRSMAENTEIIARSFGSDIADDAGAFLYHSDDITENLTPEEWAKREIAAGGVRASGSNEASIYKYRDLSQQNRMLEYGVSSKDKLAGLRRKWDAVVDRLEAVNEARETFLRRRNYASALADALEDGYSMSDARIVADFVASNATTNFARATLHFRNFSRNVPYLRSAINGTKSFWRLMSLDPVGVMGRLYTTTIIPTIALAVYNNMSEERAKRYKEIPEYVRENNFVFVSEDGYSYITIPMSENISSLLSPWRHFVEFLHDTNKASFWELAMNDLVGLSPIDLQGFVNVDRNRLFEDDFLRQHIAPGIMRVFSQVSSPLEKAAFIAVSGIDPYTGQRVDQSYKTVDPDTGEVITMGSYAGALATTLSKVAPDFLSLNSAPVMQKVLESLAGTANIEVLSGTIAIAQSVVTGGKEGAWDEMGKHFKEDVESVLVGNIYRTKAGQDWHRAVSELYADKNRLLQNEELKTLTTKINDSRTDPDLKSKLISQRNDILNEYYKKVLSVVNALNKEYPGEFDSAHFGSVLSLLNMYESGSNLFGGDSAYYNELNSQEYQAGVTEAIATMQRLGFPNAVGVNAMLGEVKRNSNGEMYIQYRAPIAVLDYQKTRNMQDEINLANIMSIASSNNLYNERSKVYDQLNLVYSKGKLSDADYDQIDAIKTTWNAKVFASLAPYIQSRTPENVLSDTDVVNEIAKYIMVPGDYQVNNRGRYVSLGDNGNKNAAYVETYIKRLFKMNDAKYASNKDKDYSK